MQYPVESEGFTVNSVPAVDEQKMIKKSRKNIFFFHGKLF
jgi:hypothetical protein